MHIYVPIYQGTKKIIKTYKTNINYRKIATKKTNISFKSKINAKAITSTKHQRNFA